jgi:hypothetical protein
MPYADPEKARAAKRESARRRRAADPQAARDYGRDQKQQRRARQRAGPGGTPEEVEMLQHYPERAVRSVHVHLGRTDDLRIAIECNARLHLGSTPHVHPWAWRSAHVEDDDHLPDEDTWTPTGYIRFAAAFAYDDEERAWLNYYQLHVTPPMLRGLRLSASRAREMLRQREEGPDDPDWRWIQAYGVEGGQRALELTANLVGEALDVRRLARYLRHHPSFWWEVRERLESRLPGGRLEQAIARLERLGYLFGGSAHIR